MAPVVTEEGGGERRAAARLHGIEEHGIVAARVRPGYRVSVVDVSAGGALVEGTYRLLPGVTVELHVETANRRAAIRGRVLRCVVACLRPSFVCYRGAICFEDDLPWFVGGESQGSQVPGDGPSHAGTRRVAATHDP
jgi:hypothetical protein